MSKVTKKELQYQINGLAAEASTRHNSIMRIHRALASIGVDIFSDDFDLTEPEPQPQLKQLDQSVFNGLDEKWRFAAIDGNKGFPIVYEFEPYAFESGKYYTNRHGLYKDLTHLTGYDTSNWQNSLIERDDIAKELLEVDLSSELTGSDYYYSKSVTERLENGQELVMCFVSNVSESDAMQERHVQVITSVDTEFNDSDGYGWQYAVPINNQGEPLTAAEVGF